MNPYDIPHEYLESVGCIFAPIGKYSHDYAFDLDGNIVAERNWLKTRWMKFPNSPDTKYRFRVKAPSIKETPEEIRELQRWYYLANH